MLKLKSRPVCGMSISPSLLDHLPPKLHYRQYQCKSCHTWLSVSWKTRIQAGVFAILFMMASAALFSGIASWLHESSDASAVKTIMIQPASKFVIIALLTVITVYLIAYTTLLLAHWIPSSEM